MLTTMSYNILEGGMSNGNNHFTEIADIVSAVEPDVLVLCEANGFERDGGRLLHEFEHRTGLRGALAPAATGFHVAVFVRRARFIRTSPLHGFYHAALRLELELDAQPLTVVGAHLCPFSPAVRLAEAELLAGEARDETPVLLMGDLNSFCRSDDLSEIVPQLSPRHLGRHRLSESAGAAAGSPAIDTRALAALEFAGFADLGSRTAQRAPTFPTELFAQPQKPAQRIDYVLASPPLAARFQHYEVLCGPEVERVSDHRPVVARFQFSPPI